METEETPEEAEPWPDTYLFWLVTTFAAIAVPAALCAGGFFLLRRFF